MRTELRRVYSNTTNLSGEQRQRVPQPNTTRERERPAGKRDARRNKTTATVCCATPWNGVVAGLPLNFSNTMSACRARVSIALWLALRAANEVDNKVYVVAGRRQRRRRRRREFTRRSCEMWTRRPTCSGECSLALSLTTHKGSLASRIG